MSTPCPDTGLLRAHLDGEAGAEVARHAEACPRCTAEVAGLRADAEVATRALALLAPGEGSAPASVPPGAAPDAGTAPDADTSSVAGTARDAGSTPADLDGRRRDRAARRAGSRRVRRFATAAAVAVMALATLGTPMGREAAASFLSQFRSERIQVVTIDPYADRNPLAALSALGTVEADPEAGMIVPAASLEEAADRTGLEVAPVPRSVLPEPFQGPPQVAVTDAAEVRIAFDAGRVRDWLEQHGSDLDVPEGIGETVLAIQLPPAVAQMFRGDNFEELVVGQSGLVTAGTEGPLTLEQLRDFLLELPGLPPAAVEQLRAIDDWRTTLPLPVPVHELDWRDTTVGGTPAVELRGTGGFGSALLWQRDGAVHGVGGLVDADTTRRIAESLVP